ncbi:signal peptidase, endoplasmic reticulum-type [Paenibacillus sp. 1_12]|uniref:hypothetical protein n=1 Tax=Paenibacillus sp. 1_12 TaxID=1566278 RepID=UPI0008F02B70|nr:hypothetical protein [Paenibacillus sp. 1_12]SFL10789.1 signal peptidase, endoplasmic reticulum-type [Paenibacillus sp. 1_12]
MIAEDGTITNGDFLCMGASGETTKIISLAIRKHGRLDLTAHGNSMFPFIREGDVCRFVSFDSLLLKKGDIAVFYSLDGNIIAHRLCQFKLINNELCYVFKGDTSIGYDEPVRKKQIIGKLIWIRKGTMIYRAEGWAPQLWGRLILTLPVLSLLLRTYLKGKANT